MLYQYIVKVLMGNSDTVFSALVMGVFGYICWLLWNINECTKSFIKDWNKHEVKLDVLKDKMDKIDEGVYRELLIKLEKNLEEMDKLFLVVNDNNKELERMRSEILSEIKDSTDELKDIIILVLNNNSRGVKHSKNSDEKRKISREIGENITNKYNLNDVKYISNNSNTDIEKHIKDD